MSGIPALVGEGARRWLASRAARRRDPRVEAEVRKIIELVRSRGDEALFELAERLDGHRPRALRVPPERCEEALAALAPARRRALGVARRHLERFHAAQPRREEAVEVMPGVRAWREFRPIERVGLYVPGGRAAYPSSVLMAAVPARLAGCRQIVVCCPGGPAGEPPESVLAAAALMGVVEVYAVGGAQAIAAMALGTDTIGRVDKVYGPGGAWVNAAKLALFAEVAVDLPAGPSEVTVWADAAADPDWVAAELVAQAEHGPDSACVAVLSDEVAVGELGAFARSVKKRVESRLADLRDLRREAAAASLAGGAVLTAASDAEALRWVNELAPEHLSIMRRDSEELVRSIRNAGSVFVGAFAPVAAGDYCSGTNHILPTGGRTRAAAALSVGDFGRWMQVQHIEPAGLERLAPTIIELAEWEGLPAHAAAVRARRLSESSDAGGAS